MPRYKVRLTSGSEISLAPKNLIPVPGQSDSGGGGGGGFPGGFPGGANLGAMLEQLPPWFREKIIRGEQPTFDDIKRLLGIEFSPLQLGIAALTCIVLYWKLGLIRAILLVAFFG